MNVRRSELDSMLTGRGRSSGNTDRDVTIGLCFHSLMTGTDRHECRVLGNVGCDAYLRPVSVRRVLNSRRVDDAVTGRGHRTIHTEREANRAAFDDRRSARQDSRPRRRRRRGRRCRHADWWRFGLHRHVELGGDGSESLGVGLKRGGLLAVGTPLIGCRLAQPGQFGVDDSDRPSRPIGDGAHAESRYGCRNNPKSSAPMPASRTPATERASHRHESSTRASRCSCPSTRSARTSTVSRGNLPP